MQLYSTCNTSRLIQVLYTLAPKYKFLIFPPNLTTPNCKEWCFALQGWRLMSIYNILQNNVPSTCLYCFKYPFSSKTLKHISSPVRLCSSHIIVFAGCSFCLWQAFLSASSCFLLTVYLRGYQVQAQMQPSCE